MKNFCLLLFVLFASFCYSQKSYSFDYVLEFDNAISLKKDKKEYAIKAYLVNSTKNNFILYLGESDSLKLSFHFLDQEGISLKSTIDKNLFIKSKTIATICKNVTRYVNPFKFQVNNYEFLNMNDTIINQQSYYHYCIKSTRSLKYQKRKKIATIHYIVDKNSPDFLPFLTLPTCYEEWKKERNIPNGIPYTIYHKNREGEITFKMQLKSSTKIDKFLVVPEECDYTKIE
mgnify:CR=1 FL=1